MKKIFTPLVVLSMLVMILQSSCALIKNDEFAQRKYYNFPRSKHNVTAVSATPANQPEVLASGSQKENDNNEKEVLTVVEDNSYENRPAVNNIQNSGNQQKLNYASRTETPETIPSVSENASSKEAANSVLSSKTESEKPSAGDSTGMFIIMFIAAFLLPFISVYLKDNGRTNQWFWITLLLCLAAAIVGGIGIMAGFGGLWGVAIIIALLVLFDVL